MKVYQITDADIERVRLRLNEDQRKTRPGLTEEQRREHDEVRRWFVFVVETWVQEITR